MKTSRGVVQKQLKARGCNLLVKRFMKMQEPIVGVIAPAVLGALHPDVHQVST